MKKSPSVSQKLKEAGATDDMIALYESYLTSDDKKGQERLLCRCRRIEREKLSEDRERFSVLGTILPMAAIPLLFFGFALAFSAKLKRISIVKLISENED